MFIISGYETYIFFYPAKKQKDIKDIVASKATKWLVEARITN